MKLGKENVDRIFKALERQIEIHGGKPVSLVVIGGTALVVQEVTSRTTRDVDILGEAIEKEGRVEIRKMEEIPEFLKKAAAVVQRDFNLPENWLNTGPASQIDLGLPPGFESRLVRKKYGDYLTVYFASRIDLIHFKLFAAVDRGGYHVEDLKLLNPSEEEMEQAARWVLTHDVSPEFREILKQCLKELGYGKVTERI